MRRYQLSGLEHVHMLRHVPRSYDMTRTHIMHRGVNTHVDVVLRCSPKNWKKKKVAVTVVKGEKKNDAARIRANAKKGYVAVRKTVNEAYEADRKVVASAYETKYTTKKPASDWLIHDMKSQLSAMAKKSADYMDDQLRKKTPGDPVLSYTDPIAPAVDSSGQGGQPLISTETEKILKEGGYRLPEAPRPDNPYEVDYLKSASDDEFQFLMDSLEKSLDEACKKYAVEPVAPEVKCETETDYSGYTLPNEISLSVNGGQQVIPEAAPEPDASEDIRETFVPTLTFTEAGGQYTPEDDLFDRELGRPGERFVPPSYLFDDEEDDSLRQAPEDDAGFVPLPDLPAGHMAEVKPQDIFYTSEDEEQEETFAPLPSDEDSAGDAQPFIFPDENDEDSAGDAEPFIFPDENDEDSAGDAEPFIFPDENDEDSAGDAEPFIFPDQNDEDSAEDAEPFIFPGENDEDSAEDAQPFIFPDQNDEDSAEDAQPFIFPDENDEDSAEDAGQFASPAEEEDSQDSPPEVDYDDPPTEVLYRPDEAPAERKAEDSDSGDAPAFMKEEDEEDMAPPMIFPDDEEDLPPPMIFPDDDEGYSPAPVSPDRNEYYDEGAGGQGVMNRSGETLYSRSGDQIKKVIGIIRGQSVDSSHNRRGDAEVRNNNVEITYSDRDK